MLALGVAVPRPGAAVALKAFTCRATGTSVLVAAQGMRRSRSARPLYPGPSLRAAPGADHQLGRCLPVPVRLWPGPDLWLGALALLLVGAAYIGVLAGCNTIVQLYAPASLRGRMLGSSMMALGVFYPIGALAQGAIANVVGIRTVTVGGALMLLALLATVLRRSIPADLEGHQAQLDS